MILGRGSYGEVSIQDGKAVKKFSKLSHLIQEYIALKYMSECKYVVHTNGVNFSNLEISMELYDCSLKKWLENKRKLDGPTNTEIMKILHDILLGLIEFHDRQLAHGDLKPGNILVMNDPLKAVLGDCGFVSIAKYAKVGRTAPIYRDPIVSHDLSHDMFSFGICFLEMVGEIRISRQANYSELKGVIHDRVKNREYQKIIYNLLHEDKNRRPSARFLLYRMFKENPPRWENSHNLPGKEVVGGRVVVSVFAEERENIRKIMKDTAYDANINRAQKGYGALISYIDNHKIPQSYYEIYTAATLMILSAIFGQSGFRENNAMELCNYQYNMQFIHRVLGEMLSDRRFINILLTP